jgi:hypothetical protein
MLVVEEDGFMFFMVCQQAVSVNVRFVHLRILLRVCEYDVGEGQRCQEEPNA